MTLYCRQRHEGHYVGSYPIALHYPEQTDEQLLDLKEASARSKGWGVDRDGSWMHIWKEYPDHPEGSPFRVDRFFEIRDG